MLPLAFALELVCHGSIVARVARPKLVQHCRDQRQYAYEAISRRLS